MYEETFKSHSISKRLAHLMFISFYLLQEADNGSTFVLPGAFPTVAVNARDG